ncbi:MAG: choice-of-anchor Q domain-containing protein [Solirubrobacterales bacterium]
MTRLTARTDRALIGFVVVVSAIAVLALAPAAEAATFDVNDSVDLAASGDVANGVCQSTGGAGNCTLRAAVQEANGTLGPDTIAIPAGSYRLTLTEINPGDDDGGAVDDLDLNTQITMNGAGVGSTTVYSQVPEGVGYSRVFETGPDSLTTITGLTVAGGPTTQGGILMKGTSLALSQMAITGHGSGSGIFVEPAPVPGGRLLTIDRSTIADNASTGSGGGISAASATTITISNSTISGNRANVFGGGISLVGSDANIVNTTLSGNTAGTAVAGGEGGGLYVEGLTGGPRNTVAFANSTIFGNTATHVGGGNLANDPGLNRSTTTIKDTILAGGTLGSGALAGTANCSGVITSLGYNLDDSDGCGFQPGTTDRYNAVAALDLLADNGGPTKTHALLPTSYAIDSASPDCGGLSADQRGTARPLGPRCDIGAVESPARPTSPTVDPPVTPPTVNPPGGGGGGKNGKGKDKKPPETGIIKGAPRISIRHRPTFKFASSEANSTFECKIDHGPWKRCKSPDKVKVGKGKHVFRVRATDKAGNTDPTPALDRFKVVVRDGA